MSKETFKLLINNLETYSEKIDWVKDARWKAMNQGTQLGRTDFPTEIPTILVKRFSG